jgi:hypothetical protein
MFTLIKLIYVICQWKFVTDQATVQVEICESGGRYAEWRQLLGRWAVEKSVFILFLTESWTPLQKIRSCDGN